VTSTSACITFSLKKVIFILLNHIWHDTPFDQYRIYPDNQSEILDSNNLVYYHYRISGTGKYQTKTLFFILIILLLSTVNLYSDLPDSHRPGNLERQNISPYKHPRVALVLSGGSARGFAHIGVISVLEEYHIPIDLIVGVSMGSIVGGYYAYGYTPREILDKSRKFKLSSIINITPGGKGILNGDKELALLKMDLDDARIENLEIPLVIVATDLTDKKVLLFDRGPLALAMRASSAIPGIFPPVYYRAS